MCEITDDTVMKILRRKRDSASVILLHWEVSSSFEDEKKCNFNSSAVRFTVDYEFEGEKCREWFFAKVPVLSRSFNRNNKLGFLENELMMYEFILPRLNRVADHCFSPVLYYSCKKKYTLIMDDLISTGYSANFKQQFGLEESLIVLQEIAKFHAASVKVLQIRADVFDWLNTKFAYQNAYFADQAGKQMIGDRFKKMVLRVDPQFWHENAKWLEKYSSNLFDLVVVDQLSQQNVLNVLNHGDCWKANIMLKYNRGAIESVKFVDFQLSIVGSPALDVFSFIMSSVKFEVFEEYGDRLLETYVHALNEKLQQFDCGICYSKDLLQRDIDGRSSFWMFALVFWMAIIFSDPQTIREKTTRYDGLLDGEVYAPIAQKWMTYFIRRCKAYPERRIFCKPDTSES